MVHEFDIGQTALHDPHCMQNRGKLPSAAPSARPATNSAMTYPRDTSLLWHMTSA